MVAVAGMGIRSLFGFSPLTGTFRTQPQRIHVPNKARNASSGTPFLYVVIMQ